MTDLLFYISIIVGIYLVMRFSGKLISKVIGLLAFLAIAFIAAYMLGFGPFKANFTNITYINEKFCEGEDKDQEICDCIVKPLTEKYKEKFTAEELKSLDENKLESAYVLEKAISSIKEKSNACLEEKGKEKAWNTFITKLLPEGFGIDKLDGLKEKFGSILEGKKERKKELDQKFED